MQICKDVKTKDRPQFSLFGFTTQSLPSTWYFLNSPQDSVLDEVLVELEKKRVGVAPVTCDALRKVVTDSAVLARLDRLQEMWPPQDNAVILVITNSSFTYNRHQTQTNYLSKLGVTKTAINSVIWLIKIAAGGNSEASVHVHHEGRSRQRARAIHGHSGQPRSCRGRSDASARCVKCLGWNFLTRLQKQMPKVAWTVMTAKDGITQPRTRWLNNLTI